MRKITVLGALPCTEGRVRVRALEHGDAAPYARGSRDESVRRHGHLPLPEYTEDIVREQIDGAIASGLADGGLAVLAIADVSSDDFLGSIVLFNVREDRAEVGFWLAPWGRGEARPGKLWAPPRAWPLTWGWNFLDAQTAPENAASRRTLLSAGYHEVGEPQTVTAPSGAEFTALTFECPVAEFRFNA